MKVTPPLAGLVVALSGCGGDPGAAVVQLAPAGAVVASSTMPAPDCAPEDCKSLRIIDGNAEAWRADAAKRDALAAAAQ